MKIKRKFLNKLMRKGKVISLLIVLGIGGFFYSGTFLDITRGELQQKYATESSDFLKTPDGKIIHYKDEGDPSLPTIVFLHGFNGSLFNFERLVPFLDNEFRLVSIDLPGFGLTGAIPSEDYSNDSFIETVNQITEHLNIVTFSIAGNSMGGGVAWRFALLHPEKIDALILLASSSISRKEERERVESQKRETPWAWRLMRSNLTKFFLSYYTPKFFATQGLKASVFDEKIATDELATQFHDLVLLTGSRNAIISMFGNRRGYQEDPDILASIEAPTLVIHGREDNIIPYESSFIFQEYIKDVELKIYPNTGHLPMYEAPEKIANDIKKFIEFRF